MPFFWIVYLTMLGAAMLCTFFGLEPAIMRDDWRLMWLAVFLWAIAAAVAFALDYLHSKWEEWQYTRWD